MTGWFTLISLMIKMSCRRAANVSVQLMKVANKLQRAAGIGHIISSSSLMLWNTSHYSVVVLTQNEWKDEMKWWHDYPHHVKSLTESNDLRKGRFQSWRFNIIYVNDIYHIILIIYILYIYIYTYNETKHGFIIQPGH